MAERAVRADERRASRGATWIDSSSASGRTAHPHLVREPSGGVHLIEGVVARRVGSGILANGLERSLGAVRDITDQDLARFETGVPVEVFEGSDGRPFIIVAGERRRLKGLPLPHRVDERSLSTMPTGDTIDLATANVSRRRWNEAMSGRFQLQRVLTAARRRGLVGSVKAVAERGRRSLTNR
jgi:hypothetical protein